MITKTVSSVVIEVKEADTSIFIHIEDGCISIENPYSEGFVFDVPSSKVDEKRIKKWKRVTKLLSRAVDIIEDMRKEDKYFHVKLA